MWKWSGLFLLFGMMLSACGTSIDDRDTAPDGENVEEHPEIPTLVEANNELAFDLLERTMIGADENVFLSPVSLYIALSLAYNGADGETKEEMESLLGFTDVELLNAANETFHQQLTTERDGAELHLANSLWLNDHFAFQADFEEALTNHYEAEVQEVDILADATPDTINDWVNKQTEGRIEDIVEPPLPEDVVAFLINAIYLDADWQYPFDPDLTSMDEFQLPDGSTKKVEMMNLKEELPYFETNDFQAVVLPYGEGDLSMQIFLPEEGNEDFTESFTWENWSNWQGDFQEAEGEIYLPAFELKYEATLNNYLEALGMETAFDEAYADFSNMVEGRDDVFISEVKQKTFLLVDEEGTVAAGATSMEMQITSAPIDGPFIMEMDRPFHLVIKDEATGAIIFIGTVNNPPARSR